MSVLSTAVRSALCVAAIFSLQVAPLCGAGGAPPGAEEARAFANEWIAAWNSHDLTRILSHYTDDFEMTSPVIVDTVGEPSGRLVGKAAVGAYWSARLNRQPMDLHFDLLAVFRSMNSLVIHYRNQNGRLVAELVEFGPDHLVRRSIAHYAD